MKKLISSLCLAVFAISMISAQKADQIVADMVNELGGKKAFYNMKNVTYNIEYQDPNSGMSLNSKETYVFNKERSYAEYSEHTILGAHGKVTEGYDGTDAWIKFNGEISGDEKANGMARFFRKTNFYWFAMLFKLQDEGVNLKHTGTKKVEGRDYDLVKVTFGDDIGDVKDTYVLYVNKKTKLVDQFLFTVQAFGITEPELMKLHYQTIKGIKIPMERVYVASNWKGEVIGKKWATTYWTNIKFNNKVDMTMFSK